MKKRIALLGVLVCILMLSLGVLCTNVNKEYWRYDEFSGRDKIFYIYDKDTAFFVIQDFLAIPVETWGDCCVCCGGWVITSVTTPCLKSNIYFVHFWNWALAIELGTLNGHIIGWGYFGHKLGDGDVIKIPTGEEENPNDGMTDDGIEDIPKDRSPEFNPDLIPV